MAAAPRNTIRSGRVAMLPKSSEPSAAPASASHVSTDATLSQDVFPQVGSISVPGEQPKVIRTGEDQ